MKIIKEKKTQETDHDKSQINKKYQMTCEDSFRLNNENKKNDV